MEMIPSTKFKQSTNKTMTMRRRRRKIYKLLIKVKKNLKRATFIVVDIETWNQFVFTKGK